MPSPIIEIDYYVPLIDEAEKLGLRRLDGSLIEVYIGVISGERGPAGPGLPVGGLIGQVPMKSSLADYITTWTSIDPQPQIDVEKDRAMAAEASLDAADALLVPLSQKGALNGVATLDSNGFVPQNQIPVIALTEFLGVVVSEAAMLSLIGQRGDWATRSDLGTDWQLIGELSSVLENWREMTYPASPVSSVNTRTGAVVLTSTDVGADPIGTAASKISDTAYDPTTWDGVTDIAPSKNAVRDKIESMTSASVSDTVYDASTWDGVTGIAPSKNAVRDKIESMITAAAALVSDTVYDASTWDGVTGIAPSKNSIRDKIELIIASIIAAISDTAYDATTWDGVTGIAPSKNAVRDKIESMLTAIAALVSDISYDATTWDGVTTVAPSKNAVRDKIESMASALVSDTAYDASAWNGITDIAPSKNAVRDKIESMGSASVSDTAYDATTWDGVTTVAPSKNAVRDKIESMTVGSGSKTVTQTAHGFVVGDVLYLNGATYAKAKADTAITSEVVGICSSVIDANTFVTIPSGVITGLSGLTAGSIYYLSNVTAGLLTVTEPSTLGHISKPVLIADTTTSGYVVNMRGQTIGAGFPVAFYGCRLYRSAALSPANNSQTPIAWDAESFDPQGMHTGSSSQAILNKIGYWQIDWQLVYALNATGARDASLALNGAIVTTRELPANSSNSIYVSGSDKIQSNALTDYLEIWPFQNSGGGLALAVGPTNCFISIEYLGA